VPPAIRKFCCLLDLGRAGRLMTELEASPSVAAKAIARLAWRLDRLAWRVHF
jgi:hypothetical protein